jgi:hypothetical protein
MVLGLVAALGGGGAGASAAAGATYCVHQPEDCAGTAQPTVQAALDAAAVAPGRDRVVVGWDTGVAPEGFTVVAGNAVDVVGDPAAELALGGTQTVRVEEPSAVVDGIDLFLADPTIGPAVDLVAGTLQNANVWVTAGAPTIRLGAGTLRNVRQNFGMEVGTGVQAVGPGGLIEDSELLAFHGLVSTSDALVIRRTLIDGTGLAPGSTGLEVRAGAVTADETTVRMGAYRPGGVAVDAAPGASGSVALTLRGATIEGDRDAPLTSTGLRAACDGGGTATVSLLDTVAWSSGLDLEQSGSGCAVALDHVRYGARVGAFADGPAVSAGPAGPMGTLTAGVGSPLIDAGSARGGDGDVAGAPRVVDGDGDGVAVRDIGAGEYQRRPPVASLVLEGTSTIAGKAILATAGGSEDPDAADRDRLAYAWSIDGARVPAGEDGKAVLEHVMSAEGTHTVGVVVTDPAGLSDRASATFRVVGPASWLLPGPPPPAPVPVPGPGPVVLPKPAPVKAALLARRPKKGKLRVGVTCATTGTRCLTSVELWAHDGKRYVQLGRAGVVKVLAGRTRIVNVKLSAKGRAVLRRHPKGLAVTVTLVRADGVVWTSGQGGRVRP